MKTIVLNFYLTLKSNCGNTPIVSWPGRKKADLLRKRILTLK
jgi:hypothetical protein